MGHAGTCAQVTPAASKSAPTVREQLQNAKKPPGDARTCNDAQTHLKRLQSGELKADKSLKEDASAALSIFKQLSDKRAKLEFSKKILENRKSLQWCKSWQQEYSERTATRTTMVSGYMTRTLYEFLIHDVQYKCDVVMKHNALAGHEASAASRHCIALESKVFICLYGELPV